ncbi:MAG TPA: 2-oxoacid:ferredoxin oxidoreductase subunit beta [Candidatus Limnocylindria bacterium]|nr:2-oxoacid:ferredoxin oxidoreductase subunit beta [Candidatus Limnocylindria bacterium]
MTTATVPAKKRTPKDFKSEIPPDWCAGCGDFGVLNALQQACAELEIPPHEMLLVSGIGCSSNLPGFFRSYGVHSLHGRALPFATGAKLANHALLVIATGGDGDGYGIGLNHFIQAMRRNIDITYIVMNNEIYGLTAGQASPTSEPGMKTKTTPHGNLEEMLNPLALALASGCGYVARGFSGQPRHLVKLYQEGIRYPGFALIDVFSPCVTFNKQNTYQFFRDRVYKLDDSGHDPADFHGAMDRAMEWGEKIPIGLFYKNSSPRASLDRADPGLESGPLVRRPLGLEREARQKLIAEFM